MTADCLNVIAHLSDAMQVQARMLKVLPRAEVLAVLRQHVGVIPYRLAAVKDGDIVLWGVPGDDRFHISRYSAMNNGFLTFGDKGWHLRPVKAVYESRYSRPEWIVRVDNAESY